MKKVIVILGLWVSCALVGTAVYSSRVSGTPRHSTESTKSADGLASITQDLRDMGTSNLLPIDVTKPLPSITTASPQDDTRSQARYRKWHWYELSQEQSLALEKALSQIRLSDRKPVRVECGDPDCRALAEDIVDAFQDANWDVSLVATFYGNNVGLWCSGVACSAVTEATRIPVHPFDGEPQYVTLVFGPKH